MTTTELTIFDQVRQALADPSGIPAREILLTDTLAGDLRMDSLDILEAVLTVEEACGVELPDDAIDQLDTVADLVALVERMKVAA